MDLNVSVAQVKVFLKFCDFYTKKKTSLKEDYNVTGWQDTVINSDLTV